MMENLKLLTNFDNSNNLNFSSLTTKLAAPSSLSSPSITTTTTTTIATNLFDKIDKLLTCSTFSNEWSSYWGPDIFCQLINKKLLPLTVAAGGGQQNNDKSATASTTSSSSVVNGSTINDTEILIANKYKCELFSSNFDNKNDSIYHCAPSLIINKLNDCLYANTSVLVKNLLNPVSELNLVLPKLIINDYCENYNQLLICDNINNTTSFYDNDSYDFINSTTDTIASSSSQYPGSNSINNNSASDNNFEPIQCLLSIAHNLIRTSVIGQQQTTNNSEQVYYDWSFLFVFIFIFAGGLGNILVCLAVALDRKLQNVTNYFLLSLAIADLLVSLFVMPLGAIPGFLGK